MCISCTSSNHNSNSRGRDPPRHHGKVNTMSEKKQRRNVNVQHYTRAHQQVGLQTWATNSHAHKIPTTTASARSRVSKARPAAPIMTQVPSGRCNCNTTSRRDTAINPSVNKHTSKPAWIDWVKAVGRPISKNLLNSIRANLRGSSTTHTPWLHSNRTASVSQSRNLLDLFQVWLLTQQVGSRRAVHARPNYYICLALPSTPKYYNMFLTWCLWTCLCLSIGRTNGGRGSSQAARAPATEATWRDIGVELPAPCP